MKFSDYFKKNFETSDNALYSELETRYYRNKLEDAISALKDMIAEVGAVLVDENDNVAGFGIVLPSIADALIKSRGKLFPTGFISVLKSISKPKELEMALVGVSSEYKNTGVNSIIMSRIMKNIIEDGILSIESNPMLESNLNIQQQWKFAQTEIIKRRQTYQKYIGK